MKHLNIRFNQPTEEMPRPRHADVFCGDVKVANVARIELVMDRNSAGIIVYAFDFTRLKRPLDGHHLTNADADGLTVSIDGSRPWPARLVIASHVPFEGFSLPTWSYSDESIVARQAVPA